MSSTIYPPKYLQLNSSSTKYLNIVIKIDDLSDLISVMPIYEKVRYGDPRLTYGLPGLVYGGLILIDKFKSYIMADQGMTISQTIEPEQGRGNVSTLSLAFLDKNEYFTKFIAPGVVVDEPLGNKLVQISLGYQNSDYPGSYFKVFRGFITNTTSSPGKVTLELSDANVKRRQEVFIPGQTTLASNIDSSVTTIPVASTGTFFSPIADINGNYDWQLQAGGSLDLTKTVRAWIKIDDEYMEYRYNGITSPTSFTVFRGSSHARGTLPAAHTLGATVDNGIEIYGNPIDLQLKIMLSGWGGPWMSGVSCVALGTTLDVLNPNNAAILFNVDVVDEYGFVIGDQVIISGSSFGNNGNYIITDIQDSSTDSNRIVILDRNLTIENPATGVSLAFRSQYDTLPLVCGLKNTPREVDIRTFQSIRHLYFSEAQYTMQLFTSEQLTGKDFIESELCLPIGVYSITRYGRLSLAVTVPPLINDKLLQLDATNIVQPETITVTRALNNRRFYNLIQYFYDADDQGNFNSQLNLYDTTSSTKINMTTGIAIQSKGLKTSLGGALVAQTRGLFILNRYKKAAYEIKLKTNWEAGSQIEVSDVVILYDPGTLQISDLETGKRGLGKRLFEVIQRSYDPKTGTTSLTLLSSLGISIEQRYATVSPSSVVIAGSTTATVEIQDSYGALYPGNEQRKWTNFIGLPVTVHSYDWTRSGTATLIGFDPSDPYKMLLGSALSFTPQPGDIVDVVEYDTGTDPMVNQGYKNAFVFFDPTVTVVSGISNTQFTVSSADAATLNLGSPVIVHDYNYVQFSPEVKVLTIIGTTITVDASLGFIPSSGMLVQGIGFKDLNGPYRYI